MLTRVLWFALMIGINLSEDGELIKIKMTLYQFGFCHSKPSLAWILTPKGKITPSFSNIQFWTEISLLLLYSSCL